LCLAATLTLAMLGGINQLAQPDEAAPQWAQQDFHPRLSTTHESAAVLHRLVPALCAELARSRCWPWCWRRWCGWCRCR
jgi:hypothetical protein